MKEGGRRWRGFEEEVEYTGMFSYSTKKDKVYIPMWEKFAMV